MLWRPEESRAAGVEATLKADGHLGRELREWWALRQSRNVPGLTHPAHLVLPESATPADQLNENTQLTCLPGRLAPVIPAHGSQGQADGELRPSLVYTANFPNQGFISTCLRCAGEISSRVTNTR